MTMTFPEFKTLLQHIDKEHSPLGRYPNSSGKTVKYVDPHIDMRTGTIFSITFRGYGWEKNLHTQNECMDLKDSLYTRCMNFLDDKEM